MWSKTTVRNPSGMRLILSTFFLTMIVGFITSCSSGSDQADDDAIRLAEEANRAITRASELIDNPVLRQISLSQLNGGIYFRFTDPAATVGVEVIAESPALPATEWQIRNTEFVRYEPGPGLDFSSVMVGAQAVHDIASDQWPACDLRSMSLASAEPEPVWYVFCNLPEGVVSGTVNAQNQVSFDFDTSDFHHTGHFSGILFATMSGALTVTIDLGAPLGIVVLSGNWAAVHCFCDLESQPATSHQGN